jgi:hypothetical protein
MRTERQTYTISPLFVLFIHLIQKCITNKKRNSEADSHLRMLFLFIIGIGTPAYTASHSVI